MSDIALFDGGAMGRAMRDFDWTRTPLGPVRGWPQSLKTVVRLMLDSRYAMWLAWGPELTFFCNDAYRPTLGVKHDFIGAPASKVWAEIWPDIGPRIDHVMSRAEATWDQGLLLFLERQGFKEETYHSFSYSPVRGDSGAVEGMLCVVTEDTERTLGERRVACLGALSSAALGAHSADEACRLAAVSLGNERCDLPFVLIYLLSEDAGGVRLVAQAGLPDATLPAAQALREPNALWPFDAVWQSGEGSDVDDVVRRIGTHAALPYPEPVQRARVLPLARAGHGEQLAGFLVAGISPRLAFDAGYQRFLALAATQVGNAIADARAFEAEQRRATALAEIDRAKTAFFTNVSHEFRTPLALVLGPLQDLSEQASTASQRELAATARRNAQRLLKLVNTLLDFARVEGGRADARFVPTNLAALTEDLASNFRAACDRAGLTLQVDCPPLPQPVFVDPGMWEKIVLNLLSNAFKFTFEGCIGVRVRSSADGAFAELQVSDTGTGITEAELPRLFQRFQRIEGARGRSFEGSGIGLSLVAELVKLHGGSIEAASVWGAGTTFTVRLPIGSAHLPSDRVHSDGHATAHAGLAAAFVGEALQWLPEADRNIDEDDAFDGHDDSAPASSDATAPLVLVADDNADLRAYLSRLLGGRYRVREAADGLAALDAALTESPDVIVSDVMMPRLDGFALVGRLRADSRTSTVPIILLSARAGEEARVEGLASGADDYLVKPFSSREFLARVNAHLAAARVRRDAAASIAAVVEQSLAGVAHTDFEGRFTAANARFLEMIGRNHLDELRGTDMLGLTHPEDRERNAAQFIQLVRGEIPWYVIEKRYMRPDGAEVWVRNHVNLLRNGDGRATEAVAIVLDITEAKRAELALHDTAEQLRVAIATAQLGQFQVELATGALTCSPRFKANFGLSSGEPISYARLLELVHADDHEQVRHTLSPSIWSHEDYSAEFRTVWPDGTLHHIAARRRTRYANDGSPQYLVGVTQDISERKAAEALLRDSAQRFRTMANTAPAMLWMTGRDNALEFISRGWFEYTGQDEAGAYRGGFGWTSMVHPDDSARAQALFVTAAARREPFDLEYRLRSRDGGFRWAIDAGRPRFAEDGTWLGYIGSVIDVHEAVEVREALRNADRRKDEFLATLAHELRNPLAPLRNSLQILRLTNGESNETKAVLEVMERQLAHVVRLVDDLMEASRITRGKIQLQRQLLDLREVVRGALETVGPKLHAAHTNLELHLPDRAVLVDGDAVRLVQVITNLLDNAAKYSETGDRITLVLERDAVAGNAVLRVRDQGTGIPAEMLPRVFELFTQVDRTLGRSQGGLGIGLALVRRLVQLHGGSVIAASDGPGRGSEFTVRLPLSTVQAPSNPGRHVLADGSALAGTRVLVVDDNRDAADSLATMLGLLGADATTAYDGPSALEAVRAGQPSIVLLDLGMPGMDGYAVAAQLRREPRYRMLKLIALTGWGQQSDMQHTREAGFDEHLVKPVGSTRLIEVLRSTLRREASD